ncbi:hypothetical protein AUR04nite_13410 [Glutamicibacter uratoxydans]|uniref:Uncharacterized protein n=1 Tax=Glutamicibacter uratoxydans TaxID=43667 RepID=A0A4Y4DKH2_GLUUR|nr:hypothetical protein [Glutamicibacter uratoxydans]GED05809.1 hypothetical protein AUR04nite_13410 [Glutamicibacter uratoxydans]
MVNLGYAEYITVALHILDTQRPLRLQRRPPTARSQRCLAQNFVFVESTQVHRGQIVSDGVTLRLDRLADDIMVPTRTFAKISEEAEAAYAF